MLSSESGINFGTLVGHIHTQTLTQNKFRDLTEEEQKCLKIVVDALKMAHLDSVGLEHTHTIRTIFQLRELVKWLRSTMQSVFCLRNTHEGPRY